MTTRAAEQSRVKKSKRKVPSYLIKEWVYDTPVYYKGYREVMKKTKTPEEIMADGMLQAILKNWLHLLLGAQLNLENYWILTGEVGAHIAPWKNASHDLVIIEKRLLPPGKVSNRYADVPPKVVIEIDTAVEYVDDKPVEHLVQLKTQQTLDFGTEKVIWIFTATQKVMVATPDADWTISDWSKTIEVLDGVGFNLAEFVEKEGINLDQPGENV
ncbi:MAG: Uma2 family endonuclease [Thermoanaerobaculia bacterium]|nr:Uma2 family endonuclease [Thermoanaerobaculia bacterium]